ncbi:MAG: ATP-binding protein [Xanthomonadales bacterium]|nr:ATP-binding protein [Gammaproteobacteria bacterium]MBT8073527.1 ATP-binding protein [Gammaproteobacteria bacterium]MBT8074862.1 ATP-binding protein [Gammaproteobacteria bacterium]NNK04369.1 ATP-binding protein [Xanthomonadales bacterium]NNK98833.1 ATP-binding protein [Xanthomonadales bacterium]
MSAEPCLDLSVKASLDNLQEIRSYIDRAGASLGVSDSALGDLRLVVDEAVTNVIIHGYGDLEGNVEIRMEAIGNSVIVRIRDRAELFDPDQIDAPQLKTPLKDRPFGGMGIFLIKKMTDEAEFLPLPGGGNEIRLVKHGAIQNGG